MDRTLICFQLLTLFVGLVLPGVYGINCVTNLPNVTYNSAGNNQDAEFDLPSCAAIKAPEILLYLGGSGDITFSAVAIVGNIKVYAQTSNPTYQLLFPNLQSLNGTLNFIEDASGATISAPKLSCWQSPDGKLQTVVNNGDDMYPTTLKLGENTGLTIQGTLVLGTTTPMYFNPSFVNLHLLGGLQLPSTSRNFTFSSLQTIGTISLNNANVGLSFPVLKALSYLNMSGSSLGGMGLSIPLLQVFATASAALNIQDSSGTALFGSVTQSMNTGPVCDCADSSAGFYGCSDFCSSSYEPTAVSCDLVPINADDDSLDDTIFDDDNAGAGLAWLFVIIIIVAILCCVLVWVLLFGAGAAFAAFCGYCCCAIQREQKNRQFNDPLNYVQGETSENTADAVNPLLGGNPVGGRGKGDFRSRQAVPSSGGDYAPPTVPNAITISDQA